MKERQILILRTLSRGPRGGIEFTGGDLGNLSAAPRVIRLYLGNLMDAGFATRDADDTFTITEAGIAELAKVPVITPSRMYCNASTEQPYTPAKWPSARPGADDHRKHASRGTGT